MSTHTSIALAALLAAGALSVPAAAAGQEEGMVVVRDAQTGKFRPPTPAELRALAPPPNAPGMVRPQAAQAVTIHKDGTLQKHLGESHMVYSVARRDGAGKLDMQCVEGDAAAKAALAHPAPATNQEHDHETR